MAAVSDFTETHGAFELRRDWRTREVKSSFVSFEL